MEESPLPKHSHSIIDYCKKEPFRLRVFFGAILKGDNAWEVMAMPQLVHSQKAPFVWKGGDVLTTRIRRLWLSGHPEFWVELDDGDWRTHVAVSGQAAMVQERGGDSVCWIVINNYSFDLAAYRNFFLNG